MSGGVETWVAIVGGLCGIVVFLAAAVPYLVGAREKASIASLTNAVESRDAEIEGLKLTVARHESTIKEQGVHIAAQDVIVASQSKRISELEALRPSAEQLQVILKAIQEHDGRVQPVIDKILNGGDKTGPGP